MKTGITPFSIIQPQEQREYYPLSFQQQRIWFLSQMAPANSLFNMCSNYHLTGEIRQDLLKKTLHTLIEKHTTLRTAFILKDNELYQKVLPIEESLKEEQIITFYNFSANDSDTYLSWKKAWKFLEKQARTPMSLPKGTLLEFFLITLPGQEHLFMIKCHHILTDGNSIQLLWDEIIQTYNQCIESGDDARPGTLKIQYHDVVAWQKSQYEKGNLETREKYWTKELSGEIPILNLPIDFQRPSVQVFNGSVHKYLLEPEITEKLGTYRYFKMNFFSVLLTAYYILLNRYSGQQDIIIGVFFNGRQKQKELNHILGYVANAVAVRIQLEDNPLISRFIKQVTRKTVQAYNHQDYPLEEILKKINLQRDMSRHPLFQVMFNLQTNIKDQTPMRNVEENVCDQVNVRTSQYEITLFVNEKGNNVEVKFEYCTDLFKKETIENMGHHFQNILKSLLERPDTQVSEVSYLSETEKKQQLEIFNNSTRKDKPEGITVVHRIIRQAETAPHQIALSSGTHQVSYFDLSHRSHQLAGFLRQQGAGPGSLIGIAMAKTIEMVTGILGILRAGAAYIPIDPHYPRARIQYIIEDSQLTQILTQEKWKEHFKNRNYITILLDQDWAKITEEHHHRTGLSHIQEFPEMPGMPESENTLIYLIYTSGSTGRPKAVGVLHKGFANLLNWFVFEFQLTGEDRVLLVSSLSFDLTQKNLYAPLIAGGKLELLDFRFFDPAEIQEWVYREGITWVNCTPSVFYSIIEKGTDNLFEKLKSLRYLFLGGEPIDFQKLSPWLNSKENQAEVVNTYGPSECTDINTYYRIVRTPWQNQEEDIPIGIPIYNTRMFILGPHLELLPTGVVGEICVSGIGVGIGYINDAQKTADKFHKNPHYSKDGDDRLLYRTGDMGKYLSDGNILYMGRHDHQVKIRGFRIELKEIENHLNRHPKIDQSIVTLKPDTSGTKQLVAYIIPKPTKQSKLTNKTKKTGTITELLNHLKKELPEYMIPSDVVEMETFPLTPNGKVDLKKLPQPGTNTTSFLRESGIQYQSPENDIEEKLHEILKKYLNHEKIGVHDNFFFIGLHSLMAAKLILHLRDAFEMELPIYTIFKTPTIKGLAETITQLKVKLFGRI
jgi:amino acid adenylation domain-containing protein